MVARKKRTYPEEELQMALVHWFGLAYPEIAMDLHHSPNGGSRSAKECIDKWGRPRRFSPEGARFKKLGVKEGWLDLQLPIPSPPYHGFFLELKAPGKKIDPVKDVEQIRRIERLRDYGHFATWTSDFEVAMMMFVKYLLPLNLKPRVKI